MYEASHMQPIAPEKSQAEREHAVKEYAQRERIEVSEHEPGVGTCVTCGDGRSDVKRCKENVIASFGEHITDSRALLVAAHASGLSSFTAEQAVTTIRDIVEAAGGTYSGHSDDHVEGHETREGEPCIGCADANLPTYKENCQKYGLTAEEARGLVDASRAVFAQNRGLTVFHGNHQERDVLIVTGERATLPHSNDSEQHFVYDLGRNLKRLRALHVEIAELYPEISWDTFFSTYLSELSATDALLLQPKHLKYYAVNADNAEQVTVKEYLSLKGLLDSLQPTEEEPLAQAA